MGKIKVVLTIMAISLMIVSCSKQPYINKATQLKENYVITPINGFVNYVNEETLKRQTERMIPIHYFFEKGTKDIISGNLTNIRINNNDISLINNFKVESVELPLNKYEAGAIYLDLKPITDTSLTSIVLIFSDGSEAEIDLGKLDFNILTLEEGVFGKVEQHSFPMLTIKDINEVNEVNPDFNYEFEWNYPINTKVTRIIGDNDYDISHSNFDIEKNSTKIYSMNIVPKDGDERRVGMEIYGPVLYFENEEEVGAVSGGSAILWYSYTDDIVEKLKLRLGMIKVY